jgi:hypothetical protein
MISDVNGHHPFDNPGQFDQLEPNSEEEVEEQVVEEAPVATPSKKSKVFRGLYGFVFGTELEWDWNVFAHMNGKLIWFHTAARPSFKGGPEGGLEGWRCLHCGEVGASHEF